MKLSALAIATTLFSTSVLAAPLTLQTPEDLTRHN
ncbi:hypothetical protein V7P28_01250, partial [Klebsiella michiganensis]